MKKGFTLIELLVVIAIMAVLAIVLMPKLGSFSRDQNLQAGALDLQSHIRLTQSNAASGVKCKPDTGASSWYLKIIDSNSYKIETRCQDSEVGDTTPTPTPPQSTTYNLPAGVVIYSVSLDTCETIGNLADFMVSFNNIDAQVNFTTGSSGCLVSSMTQKMIIKLELDSNPDKILNVVVERGGSTYISS